MDNGAWLALVIFGVIMWCIFSVIESSEDHATEITDLEYVTLRGMVSDCPEELAGRYAEFMDGDAIIGKERDIMHEEWRACRKKMLATIELNLVSP